MAYNVSAFTDYIARENETLTATLFAGGDTGKFARFMTGVKGSTTVPKVSGSATLQAGLCKTPSGDTVVSQVTLKVEPFTAFESFCQDDLQTKFPNMVLAPGSSNADAPANFEDAIVDVKVASINETLENTYWQGTKGSGSYPLFDGFIKVIDTATTAIDGNTGAATSITKANVIAIIDAMIVAAPAIVKRNKDFTIAAGDDVFDMYIAALKSANLYHYSAEHDNGVLKLGGSGATLMRVYGLNGTSRIFAGIGSNFIVGSDVVGEENVVDTWYDKTDDKVYLRVKGKSGVTVDNIDQIVEFTVSS